MLLSRLFYFLLSCILVPLLCLLSAHCLLLLLFMQFSGRGVMWRLHIRPDLQFTNYVEFVAN